MTCPYCNGELVRVRTDSPWEFELWCEPCVKHISVTSYSHAQEPPTLRGVLETPPDGSGAQRRLF